AATLWRRCLVRRPQVRLGQGIMAPERAQEPDQAATPKCGGHEDECERGVIWHGDRGHRSGPALKIAILSGRSTGSITAKQFIVATAADRGRRSLHRCASAKTRFP